MKIRVIGCSRDTYWYASLLGECFEVEEVDNGYGYKLISDTIVGVKYFQKQDIEIIDMKNKVPHKHAEVIKAFADGDTIQLFYGNTWVDTEEPMFRTNAKYRVKPNQPVYPPVTLPMAANLDIPVHDMARLLEIFVSSGALKQYVEKHGVDGLKGQ